MYHIIVNPIAGRGKTLSKVPFLTRFFDVQNIPYEVLVTESAMDAFDKAKAVCASGSDGIIGIGGDGTIQEIVAGMSDGHDFSSGSIPVPLGIFPGGSGNDFVMTLAGGKKKALARYKKAKAEESARDFFEAVVKNRTITSDLITVGGMAYLNIGNIGLDARVVRNAIAYKQRFGRYAYVAAVYKSIARHTNMPLTIEIDGVVKEGEYTLVAVCNGQYYGGGLHITPQARLDDGKITVCLVKAMSRAKTMVIFPSLMIGRHDRLKAVSFHECEDVRITLKKGVECISLDGNLHEVKNGSGYTEEEKRFLSPYQLQGAEVGELHFQVKPGAINIFL
ncbi:MAG: hypothetical protein FWE11_09495 [Defluviitaleaceae bacterium]|nr:hypothetical protein [Defluviitaleaceae bacterium]